MNELIKIDDGGKITARELYEFLELRPGDFSRWAKTNIVENQFAEEGMDWMRLRIHAETPTGGQMERDDYRLTIDFAKKLCMVSKSTKGEQARDYFIEAEKRLKALSAPTCIEDMMIAQLLSMKELRLKQLEQGEQIRQLAAKIATSPAEYYTIAGYASLRGIKVDVSKASLLGRKAAKLSVEYGYHVGKTHDPRFGQVNTYHLDALNEVFQA